MSWFKVSGYSSTMNANPFYRTCATFYDGDYESARYVHDIPHYVDLARTAGGPVLELGCGTGRILLPIARAGVEITGVEPSPEMLSRLCANLAAEPEEVQRRVTLVEATAGADLDLERRFPLALAPFRVLQHLIERPAQRAFLRAVARHLAPGGLFAFDVFQPDYEMIGGPPHLAVDVERTDPATGRILRRAARAEHTPEEQTFDTHLEWWIGQPDEPGYEEHHTETVLRWYTKGEIELLLELEGFEVVEFWGSFDRQPFGPGAEDQVVLARRVG